MARKVVAKDQLVKLLVGAGQASPSPPVGPALGSKGVKSMDFCKEFNARTAAYIPGTPIPALVTVRPDRSFSFVLRTPPTSHLLLQAAGVEPVKGRLRGAGNTPGPRALASAVARLVAEKGAAGGGAAGAGAGGAAAAERASVGGGSGEGGDGSDDNGGVVAAAAAAAASDARAEYRVDRTGKAASKDLVGNAKLGTVGTVSLKHVYEIARIKSQESRLQSLGLENIAKSIVGQAGSIGIVVVP